MLATINGKSAVISNRCSVSDSRLIDGTLSGTRRSKKVTI